MNARDLKKRLKASRAAGGQYPAELRQAVLHHARQEHAKGRSWDATGGRSRPRPWCRSRSWEPEPADREVTVECGPLVVRGLDVGGVRAAAEARVIGLPRGLSVFIFAEPVDMRKSFHTLSALVEQEMKRDVLEGDLFLFVSRSRKRAKVLYFDGTGLCLLAKKLERGQFSAPWKLRRHELSLSELALLFEGSEAERHPLSPPLPRKVDLQPKFPQETC